MDQTGMNTSVTCLLAIEQHWSEIVTCLIYEHCSIYKTISPR